jgi:hypothetical protein
MESSPRTPPWLGAGWWALCFQFFVAEQIARLRWPGQYSMSMNWISDLGTANSPLYWVMNGSFVLQGVLISVGAILMGRLFPAKWSYRIALLLFLASGLGVFAAAGRVGAPGGGKSGDDPDRFGDARRGIEDALSRLDYFAGGVAGTDGVGSVGPGRKGCGYL